MSATTTREAKRRRGRRLLALAFAAALLPVPAADARLGDLDPSFGSGGIATPNVGATTGAQFEAVASRADGRPVAVGTAGNGALEDGIVVQLTAAGGSDSSFGTTGAGLTRVASPSVATRLHGVALDVDGRVLAAGDQRSSTGPTTPVARRFTPTGALDGGFSGAIGGTGEARAIVPLPDGAMIVAGWRVPPGGSEGFFAARLTAAGALDTASGFGGGDGVADVPVGSQARAEAMAVNAAGRIVLAGWVRVVLGNFTVDQPVIMRVTAAGALDPTFGTRGIVSPVGTNPDGSTNGQLRAVLIDGADRIVAAGVSGRFALVTRRLDSGAADESYANGGTRYGAVQNAAALNAVARDGARTVVAGRASDSGAPDQLLLGSLDASGAPEPAIGGAPAGWRSFGGAGEAFGVALGPGGTVYTAGGPQPFIARHLPNAAPTAALAAPATAVTGEPVTFDAVASTDPEGEQLRYTFDLDGNGSFEFDGGQNPLALRSFASAGVHVVGVRVTDPRGASAAATRSVTVTAGRVPRPVLGKQGVAKPLSGIVRYRLPGKRRFKRLTKLTAIPNGTEIDARKGRLLLTVLHDASGRLDGARFYAGRFVFRQGKGKTPITTLKLTGGSFRNCTVKGQTASIVAVASSVKGGTGTRSSRRVRKLWGDGRGRFRTRGRYGAATVRGTKWLTLDRCDGTKVRVVRGKVSVQDLVRPNRRPKLVRAGEKTFVASG